jgi:hypothetical protein
MAVTVPAPSTLTYYDYDGLFPDQSRVDLWTNSSFDYAKFDDATLPSPQVSITNLAPRYYTPDGEPIFPSPGDYNTDCVPLLGSARIDISNALALPEKQISYFVGEQLKSLSQHGFTQVQITTDTTKGPTNGDLEYLASPPDGMSVNGSTLTLNGDAGRNNQIVVEKQDLKEYLSCRDYITWNTGFHVNLNGREDYFPQEMITKIVIAPGAGNNSVNLSGLPDDATVEVDGFYSAHDSIRIGSPTDDWYAATINLEGYFPSNLASLTIDDYKACDTVQMSHGAITFRSGKKVTDLSIHYDGANQLMVAAGENTSEVDVLDTTGSTATTLSLSGKTAVNVSPSDKDGTTVHQLTVHGGGNTTLTVNDQANPLSPGQYLSLKYVGMGPGGAPLYLPVCDTILDAQYTITGPSLQCLAQEKDPTRNYALYSIGYDGLAGLNVNLGNHTNVVNVNALPGPTKIQGGTGTNIINVSPITHNLDGLDGLTVCGASSNGATIGNTTLNVYDEANPHLSGNVDTSYSIGGGVLQRRSDARHWSPLFHGQGKWDTKISYAHLTGINLYTALLPTEDFTVGKTDCPITIQKRDHFFTWLGTWL